MAHMEYKKKKKKIAVFVCLFLDFCVARGHMKEPHSSWQRSSEIGVWQRRGLERPCWVLVSAISSGEAIG